MASCAIKHPSEEKVVQQLNELFGNVLNLDVIRTVAGSCEYDVLKSSNKLLEITSYGENRNSIEMDNFNTAQNFQGNRQTSVSITSLDGLPKASVKQSKKALDFERTIKTINKGYKVLVILRGLPGSGKSYLAKQILEQTIAYDCNNKQHILSTDDFFYLNREGVYQYDVTRLDDAHNWNQRRAFETLSRGFSPVIIDNTNVQMWEMKAYASMATDYGYLVEILEPGTHWCFNDKELTKRNRHGVSKLKIIDMLQRYEKNVTPQKLLGAYNLTYRLQKPPQLRLYPPPNIDVTNSIKTYGSGSMLSSGATALKHQSQKQTVVEVIDLMEFNDDDALTNNANLRKSTSASSSADFLMTHNEVTSSSKKDNVVDDILMITSDPANVLQPQQNKMEVISIDSSDEEQPNKEKVFPDIESAWGISEHYLKSWDIVTPLENTENLMCFPDHAKPDQTVEMKDSSSNTDDDDFKLLKKPHTEVNHKVLRTLNRDINMSTPKREPKIPKRSVIDKSCMTDDVYEDYENHMAELESLFPSAPSNHLRYWYNKCKGDLEWTIEFLLEAKDSELFIDESPVEEPERGSKDVTLTEQNVDNILAPISPKVLKYKKAASEKYNEIKKIIESKIDISPTNYSKRLLRIKNFKFSSDNVDPQPSTSSIPPEKDEKIEVITLEDSDSDMEFENVSIVRSEHQPEETVELNLGDHFVTQLEKQFGDVNLSYPKGFQPVIQVPVTLARQLYTFYIESVFQQMENQNSIMEALTNEDEEFAKKLQAKEQEELKASKTKTPTSFKEIMEEQATLSQCQKEADKWKTLNPDNLAAKLTRQKLFNSFPTIDQDTLVEILYAHDNKYEDTIESLLASTGSKNVVGIIEMVKEPPIKDDVLQEMKEAHTSNVVEDDNEVHEATYYREEAKKILSKRADLYVKVQHYHQRGMIEVAQFYSGLASQQTVYYERANNLAVTAFLDEHAKRLEDFNTLDLHFLYVKEAIPALDVFLDRNINLLRQSEEKQSEYLHIITGRGNRSENGVPKLRPAVMNRLTKRKIHFGVLNPGLLKVKITKNLAVTSALN